MPSENAPSSVTHASGAADDGAPDLRLLHYNDVYHIDQGYSDLNPSHDSSPIPLQSTPQFAQHPAV